MCFTHRLFTCRYAWEVISEWQSRVGGDLGTVLAAGPAVPRATGGGTRRGMRANPSTSSMRRYNSISCMTQLQAKQGAASDDDSRCAAPLLDSACPDPLCVDWCKARGDSLMQGPMPNNPFHSGPHNSLCINAIPHPKRHVIFDPAAGLASRVLTVSSITLQTPRHQGAARETSCCVMRCRSGMPLLRRKSLTLTAPQPRSWTLAESAASMPPGAEWMAGGASPTGRSTPSGASSPVGSGTSPLGTSPDLHEFWGELPSPITFRGVYPLQNGFDGWCECITMLGCVFRR